MASKRKLPEQAAKAPHDHASVGVLVIAVGNTHTRVGLARGHGLEESAGVLPTTEALKRPRNLLRFIRPPQAAARPLQVVVGGVVPKACDRIEATFNKDKACKVWRFRKNLPCPLQIVPRPAKNVGDDRLLGALGALAMDSTRPWVVVDAGTAVTVNAVRPAGESGRHAGVFEGGLIFPGEALALRALHEGTAKLPPLEPNGKSAWYREPDAIPTVGRSTNEAIAAGVRRAQVAAVRAAVEAQLKVLGPRARIFLTGGGADTFWQVIRKNFSSRKPERGEPVTLGLFFALAHHRPELFHSCCEGAH